MVFLKAIDSFLFPRGTLRIPNKLIQVDLPNDLDTPVCVWAYSSATPVCVWAYSSATPVCVWAYSSATETMPFMCSWSGEEEDD
jgi:hypothetical protein